MLPNPMPDITLENIAFWQHENPIRWVETTEDDQKNSFITLHTGPQGETVAYSMHSAIAAYARNGCNCIVDFIAYKQEWLDDLHKKLDGIETLWVKVEIPLDVVEQREIARGTSPRGHARSHHATVYWDKNYDLTVNSGADSSTAIALAIKNKLSL